MIRRQHRTDVDRPGPLGGHVQRTIIAGMITISFCLGMGVDDLPETTLMPIPR